MMSTDPSDRLTATLGRVLDWGNRISATLLALGLVLLLVGLTRAGDVTLRTGLVTLLGTPAARVIVVALGFLRAKEWRPAAMSGMVLLILIGSTIVALR